MKTESINLTIGGVGSALRVTKDEFEVIEIIIRRALSKNGGDICAAAPSIAKRLMTPERAFVAGMMVAAALGMRMEEESFVKSN